MVWSRAMRRSLRMFLSALLLLPFEAVSAESIGGAYVGAYINKAGKSGDYQLTLTPGQDGNWTGEVVAVLDGRPTKSAMTSLVVKGDSIEAAYDFEVKGHKASSRITGTRTGQTLSGTFETLYKGKVVDTGTWKTSWKK
jgi:hypothetical protein